MAGAEAAGEGGGAAVALELEAELLPDLLGFLDGFGPGDEALAGVLPVSIGLEGEVRGPSRESEDGESDQALPRYEVVAGRLALDRGDGRRLGPVRLRRRRGLRLGRGRTGGRRFPGFVDRIAAARDEGPDGRNGGEADHGKGQEARCLEVETVRLHHRVGAEEAVVHVVGYDGRPDAEAQEDQAEDDADHGQLEAADVDRLLGIVGVQEGPEHAGKEDGEPGLPEPSQEQGDGHEAEEEFLHGGGHETGQQGVDPGQPGAVGIAVLGHRRGSPHSEVLVPQDVEEGDVSEVGESQPVADEDDPAEGGRAPASRGQPGQGIAPARVPCGGVSGRTEQDDHDRDQGGGKDTAEEEVQDEGEVRLRRVVPEVREWIAVEGPDVAEGPGHHSHDDGDAPAQLAPPVLAHEEDGRGDDQGHGDRRCDIVDQAGPGTDLPVIAGEGLGYLEVFPEPAGLVALHRHPEPVVAVLADDEVPLPPGEGVVPARRAVDARGLDRLVVVEGEALHLGEEALGHGAGLFLRQAGALVRLEDGVGESRDPPAGIEVDPQLLLLQRLEPADLPGPDRDPVPHETVGLRQPQGALQEDLGQPGAGEDPGALVLREVVAEAFEVALGRLEGLLAVEPEVEGGHGPGAVVEPDVAGQAQGSRGQEAEDPEGVAAA